MDDVSGGTYLTNWLSIGDRVCGLCCSVAAEEVVGHECRTQSLDHQVVVVQGCDNNSGRCTSERSGDVRSRHVEKFGCNKMIV